MLKLNINKMRHDGARVCDSMGDDIQADAIEFHMDYEERVICAAADAMRDRGYSETEVDLAIGQFAVGLNQAMFLRYIGK